MTAEVAILNKQGIALAADSAVTVRSGHKDIKTYNSANKLFSLQKQHSVGFMVYNISSFMGIPWETIIKSFKDYIGGQTLKTLGDYGDSFIAYICQDKRYKIEELEEGLVIATLDEWLKGIMISLKLKMQQDDGSSKDNTNDYEDLFCMLINQRKEHIQETFENKLLDISYADYLKGFGEILTDTILTRVKSFLPQEISLSKDIMDNLLELSFEAITSEFYSSSYTGIVIAGFGEDDIFPSLVEFQIEGFICGKLKYSIQNNANVSYQKTPNEATSHITAFAQYEMVQTFLNGIDPNMEKYMVQHFQKAIDEFPVHLQKELEISFDERETDLLSDMQQEIFNETIKDIQTFKKNEYILPVLNISDSLPQEELAEMAETLVHLTSFKRRVSNVEETVGGPIDVAIITKGDGFVWVKRKELFRPEINNY